jgi:hypothetical protein
MNDPRLLEHVSKAIAFCHYKRGARSPKLDWVEQQANKHWEDFEDDALLVIEVINQLVQQESFDDAVAALPNVPAFLTEASN